MKTFQFMNSLALYIEITQNSFKALDGDDGLEFSLERQENGRLTPACVERLTESLRVFLKRHSWQPRRRAFCAIGARGVSLRRLTLPACSKDELERLLVLQIEREFPLTPDEMAWGYRQLGDNRLPRNGSPATREVLVAAVKRDIIKEYSDILAACDLVPVFTLGALARSSLCTRPPASYAVLELAQSQSELISFENGVPSSIRTLPWGSQDLEKASSESSDDDPQILAQTLELKSLGQKLYVTGLNGADVPPRFASALAPITDWERVRTPPGEGRSAAILGLKKTIESGDSSFALQLKTSREADQALAPTAWKWAATAVVLAIVAFSLRYAEVFIQKPRLVRKINEVRAYRAKLPNLDRELNFLQYLQTNQPPYFDPLFAMASAAPSGTRIDSLTMNRRGDISIRATMRDPQQVTQFRSKLIDSGMFSSLVVEEQNPSPDRQKIAVRMVGEWQPTGQRKPPAASTVPTRQETTKSQAPTGEVAAASTLERPPPPLPGSSVPVPGKEGPN